jgi:hypothetical protein
MISANRGSLTCEPIQFLYLLKSTRQALDYGQVYEIYCLLRSISKTVVLSLSLGERIFPARSSCQCLCHHMGINCPRRYRLPQ